MRKRRKKPTGKRRSNVSALNYLIWKSFFSIKEKKKKINQEKK